jgi:hypothetical protein
MMSKCSIYRTSFKWLITAANLRRQGFRSTNFQFKTNVNMKQKFLINHLTLAFASLLLAVVFQGCSWEHDGKLVKDTEGKIYKLEGNGRTSEAYHLIPVDTVDYKGRFK